MFSRFTRRQIANSDTNDSVVYLATAEEKEERLAINSEPFVVEIDLPCKHSSNSKPYGQTFLGLSW